jgi:uncharacterized Zn-binding protein involved in type VI secretion
MLELAARVGDPVAHATYRFGLVGMVGGALLGAAAVLAIGAFVGPAAAASVTGVAVIDSAIAFLGGAFTAGGTGAAIFGSMNAAWVVTQFTQTARKIGEAIQGPMEVSGMIATGAITVAIGPSIAPAAMASPRCLLECHAGAFVGEGSSTISIENAAASRRGDKTTCPGVIAHGDETVFFGGDPTSIAGDIAIERPHFYRVLSMGVDYANTIFGFPADRSRAEIWLWLLGKTAGTLGRQDIPGHEAAAALGGAIDAYRGRGTFGRAYGPAMQRLTPQTGTKLGVGTTKLGLGLDAARNGITDFLRSLF